MDKYIVTCILHTGHLRNIITLIAHFHTIIKFYKRTKLTLDSLKTELFNFNMANIKFAITKH